jgi:hypothetical protein
MAKLGMKILSADLSKATDALSERTTRKTLEVIAEAAQFPGFTHDIISAITKPQLLTHLDGEELEEPKLTSAGALMGLGPSWTVMSLLNNFAAVKAGIHPDRFRTCGDDLVALGTTEEFDRYETNLYDLTFLPNAEKSFRGLNGVFCERFVKTQIEGTTKRSRGSKSAKKEDSASYQVTATSESHVRIAQSNGVRLLSRGMKDSAGRLATTTRLLALSRAQDSKIVKPSRPIREALLKTIKRFAVGDCGPISHGGGGRGAVNHKTLMMYLTRGVFNPIKKYRSSDQQEIIEHFRSAEISQGDSQLISRADALQECLIAQASYDQCLGHTQVGQPVPMKVVRAKWNARYKSVQGLTPFKALRIWHERNRDNMLIAEDEKPLQNTVLKIEHHIRNRNYRRAINVASNFQLRAPFSIVKSLTMSIPQTTRVLNPEVNLRTLMYGQRYGFQ